MAKMMADDLPFRSQADAVSSGVRPVGELTPFRERGQTAPGGESMASDLGTPDALGHGGGFPAKLKD